MADRISEEALSAMELDGVFTSEGINSAILQQTDHANMITGELPDDVFANRQSGSFSPPSPNQPGYGLPPMSEVFMNDHPMDDVFKVDPTAKAYGQLSGAATLTETVGAARSDLIDDSPAGPSSISSVEGERLSEFPLLNGQDASVSSSPSPIKSMASPSSSPSNAAVRTPSEEMAPAVDGMSKQFLDSSNAPGMSVKVVVHHAPDSRLPYSSRRTGVVYDPRMRFHSELDSSDDIHPEDPRRVYDIWQALIKEGFVDSVDVHASDDDDQSSHSIATGSQTLARLQARMAHPSELALTHTQDHIKWVEALRNYSDIDLKRMGKPLDSVYLHQMTYYCAALSAGSTIDACRAVVSGQVKNAIAVVRPPGHHAEHDHPGGFCFFNNACVATRVCQKDFPDLCRKILILDWDVHHGNGIQNIFYDDPNILYISLHVFRNGKFYPGGPGGDHRHVGQGQGEGKNINIPWPQHGMGDGDYLLAFQQIVMPVAQEFDPDLVIIAAGFDAAEGDALGQCLVSPAGYAHMTHMLKSLAGGKVVAVLEGGYNLESIAKSAVAVTKTLMGEPPDRIKDLEPCFAGIATVKMVIAEHSKYWKCLYPKDRARERMESMGGKRLDEVLRQKQVYEWSEKYQMGPIHIWDSDGPSPNDKHYALASSDYVQEKPLVIVLHGSPETDGLTDWQADGLDADNLVVTDFSTDVVDWARRYRFAVIDLLMPKYVPDDDESSGLAKPWVFMRNKLITYVWENYIELGDHPYIYLIGHGHDAAEGIVELLNTKDSVKGKISGIFTFLPAVRDLPLPAVNKPIDEYFPQWYYSKSMVFVADDHHHFAEKSKKGKRTGRVFRSPYIHVNDMLKNHQEEIFQKITSDIPDYFPVDPGESVKSGTVTPQSTSSGDKASNRMSGVRHHADLNISFTGDVSEAMGLGSPARIISPRRSLPPMGTFTITSPDKVAKE